MRIPFLKNWGFRLALVLTFVVGSIALVSAPGPGFGPHDKAFYADANLVNFVRPGLVFKIVSVDIAADGTAKVRFKLTDPQGLPLDRLGVTTPGAVSTSFILARIPAGKTQYESYTTRTQTSPITNQTAIQAGADSGGTYAQVGDGEYIYTLKTKLPQGYDKTATHTVGMYGARNLTEFDLGTNSTETEFHFVPDGSKPPAPRDVIKTATCNKCHQHLAAHGEGGRQLMEGCILCHQPQTKDPDTGETVDMAVMIHKIHQGEGLPSVQAGKPYIIIGNRQSVHDFSEVVFPADTRNCTFCHEQNTGAAQADAYFKPNMAACGSCHDNVNFATGENHANLPQVSNNQCANCHTPDGEVEFDISITRGHTIPRFSRDLPGFVFDLVKVDEAGPGKSPVVTFKLTDKAGKPILASEVTRLNLVLAGPTSDYGWYVSEDVRQATAGQDGTHTYKFTATLPADAKGTYAVGIEGYRNMVLLANTPKQMTVRDAGVNKQIYFSVDGSSVQPRRQVAALDMPDTLYGGCNKCHASLSLHGDNRNQIEQCVMCHNPNETDKAVRPAGQLPAQAIDFRTMVHKIHTGEELPYDYTVYGRGGTPHNYNKVLYPGDRRRCNSCHVNDSQQLPLNDNLLNVTDPRGVLNPVGPTTAACTGCHTAVYAASHALANTTTLGESCAACHKPGADFALDRVHAE
jgi:OmcA/MtrC family decaheme c-type cytochrome